MIQHREGLSTALGVCHGQYFCKGKEHWDKEVRASQRRERELEVRRISRKGTK